MKAVVSQTFHPGINYSLQKDRDYIWNATNRHSELASNGVPKNVLIVGAGEGQGVELPKICNDVEIPNEKSKFNITMFSGKFSGGGAGGSFNPINDSASYNFSVRGKNKLPFNIFSGSLATGYNSRVVSGYKTDAVITNIHSDTTDFSNDVPLQGPFARSWVGGHQSRHVDVNRYDTSLRDDDSGVAPPNNIDNLYTRPEAWRLIFVEYTAPGSDGAFGLTDPQYGITKGTGKYPDTAKKSATLYRDGRAKRPFNISNIQTITSSTNHGNYSKTYEIISVAGGVHENNFYLRDNPNQTNYLAQRIINILPETTNPMTLLGQDPSVNGNVFGKYTNNRQPDGALIDPGVTGVKATGSFRVTGSYIAGTTASNSAFRVFSPTGSQFTNLEGIRIVDGTGVNNDNRFLFLTGAVGIPYVDSYPNFYIVTGSSNTQFWNNIETKIEAQTDFSVSYNAVTPPNVEGLRLENPNNRIQLQTGSLPTQFTASSFTFSGWINLSRSATDRYVFDFKNSSGDTSRELFVSSGGELTYKAYGANGVNRCTASWSYVNFQTNHQDTLVHVAVSHNLGGGYPGSVDIYINSVAQSVLHPTPIGTSLGACSGASFITSTGLGTILNSGTTSNKGLMGSGSNFSFWSDNLNAGQIRHIYNGGNYFDVAIGSYCAYPALRNERIAWFPMTKIGNAGNESIFGNNFVFTNPDGHATDGSGPPQVPYADFTVSPPDTGSAYNTTLSNNGFGSVVACGTVLNMSNATGGTNYRGAYPSGSITIDKTFVMAATATSPSIAVPQFTGGTNSAFWNALSQSIKDNTAYDTIVVNDHGNGTATFSLTASVIGSTHNKTISRAGPNSLFTFISLAGIAGGVDYVAPTFGTDITITRITSSISDLVFTTRFSGPGGIEAQSYGYLDAYAHEYSVYNNLNYRNLTVRGSGSGESGTIRLDDQLGNRHGLKTHLRRHSGKFGSDSVHGSVVSTTYVTSPSLFKQQRNENRRPSDTSTITSPVLVTRHDNMYINSPIPRSDFQYKWVTSSIGSNYSITSGKQRMYGYAHPSGIMSSSAVIDGDSGFVPAITFPTASEIFGV